MTSSRDQQPAAAPAQPHNRRRPAGLVRAAGGVLAVASCLPMIAMLPGAAATALGALGVDASTRPWAALRHALDPVARPLLVLSVLLLVAGSLRCGRAPAALAAAGGALLYVSMYLASGSATAAMAGMGTHTGTGTTNAPLFYAGIGLIATTFAWSAVRCHRRTCRPAWQRSTRTAPASTVGLLGGRSGVGRRSRTWVPRPLITRTRMIRPSA